jgi:hypothetical protein
MVEECTDNILRKFDANQDFLWLWNPSKGKSGGILVGIKKELYDVGSFKQGQFMLQVNLWDKQNHVKWNLLVVYGAAQEENKTNFLAELSHLYFSSVESILIVGGLNIIRYANENNRNNGVHRHIGMFNTLIHLYELRELIMTRGRFTWSNNQEFSTLEKLGRILMTKEWEDLFPLAMIKKLPREVFDHNPLILLTGSQQPTKAIMFRFEVSWLKNPEFLLMLREFGTNPVEPNPLLIKFSKNYSW